MVSVDLKRGVEVELDDALGLMGTTSVLTDTEHTEESTKHGVIRIENTLQINQGPGTTYLYNATTPSPRRTVSPGGRFEVRPCLSRCIISAQVVCAMERKKPRAIIEGTPVLKRVILAK